MKFDKIKALYWIAGVLLATLATGLIIFGSSLWNGESALQTQGEFSLANYPGPDYIITFDTLAVDSFRIVLIVCHDVRTDLGLGDVWMRCLAGDSMTEKYIGPMETEAGVWIPDPQPIPGMFMAVQCGEYDGIVHLVDKLGEFISFPGRRYALDQENRIYTAFAEYDTLVYEYDLIKGSGQTLRGKHLIRHDLTLQGGRDRCGYWVE